MQSFRWFQLLSCLVIYLLTGTISISHAQELRLADDYNSSGSVKYNSGDLDGAIADFNMAVKADPQLAISYCNRGIALNEKGETDRAIADFNKAIELDPRLAIAYYSRGNIWYVKGNLSTAIAD